jgi:hypothetical protein
MEVEYTLTFNGLKDLEEKVSRIKNAHKEYDDRRKERLTDLGVDFTNIDPFGLVVDISELGEEGLSIVKDREYLNHLYHQIGLYKSGVLETEFFKYIPDGVVLNSINVKYEGKNRLLEIVKRGDNWFARIDGVVQDSRLDIIQKIFHFPNWFMELCHPR